MTERFERFLTTEEDFLSQLKDWPELRQISQQRDERRVDRIHELLAQRETLKREQAETMRPLEADRDEAQRSEQKAHEAWQAARQKRINAEHARLGANSDFALRLTKLEAEIRQTAPREIDEFIFKMLKIDDAARLAVKTERRPGQCETRKLKQEERGDVNQS